MSMIIAVTGASGFLGRHVVEQSVADGHRVRALDLPTSDIERCSWSKHPSVTVIQTELDRHPSWFDSLRGADAVIHLAATMSGNMRDQELNTIQPTVHLLDALRSTGVPKLVLVSSFAVYDFLSLRNHDLLDEEAPIEALPERREPYCRAKIDQERLVKDATQRHGLQATVVRPGMVYGPDHCWSGRLGIQLSPRLWMAIGSSAIVPITYVANCAAAIVRCAESEETIGEVVNVVDDVLPSQRDLVRLLRDRVRPRPYVIPVPLWAMFALARAATAMTRLTGGRPSLPQVLRLPGLHARTRPLRFDNAKLKSLTGWSPEHSLVDVIDECFGLSESAGGSG